MSVSTASVTNSKTVKPDKAQVVLAASHSNQPATHGERQDRQQEKGLPIPQLPTIGNHQSDSAARQSSDNVAVKSLQSPESGISPMVQQNLETGPNPSPRLKKRARSERLFS